jgi:hypothetical protein
MSELQKKVLSNLEKLIIKTIIKDPTCSLLMTPRFFKARQELTSKELIIYKGNKIYEVNYDLLLTYDYDLNEQIKI